MANRRIENVRKYIDLHGEVTVDELVELCDGCSKMTIWRYLKRLEEEGAIRRIRGGAISNNARWDKENLYFNRMHENSEAKRRIACAALPFLDINSSIFLDSGSTIMNLAKQLPNQHYVVVTSGANIAMELSQRVEMNVTCLGGEISGATLALSGPQAEAFVDMINIDTAVLSASGYSEQGGFTIGSSAESQLKRKVIHKAARTILLMDSSKQGRTLPFTFATLEDVDIFVGDGPLPQDFLDAAQKAGVKLVEV